jgi:diguanylate cyclase (GGDEF)-like protein
MSTTPTSTTTPPGTQARTNDGAPQTFLTRIAATLAGWSRQGEDRIDGFDDLIKLAAESSDTGAFDRALVRLAAETAGSSAVGVELWRDRGWGPRRAAVWVGSVAPKPAEPANRTQLDFPVQCGLRAIGTLRVVFDGSEPVAPEVRRRLTSIAMLAAAFEWHEGQSVSQTSGDVSPHDAVTGLPNELFLRTFLTYASALAHRRNESISVFYLAIDRLPAILDLHGHELANEALRKVGRIVGAGLRASDMVARLADGRLVAVLPAAGGDDAMRVAEAISASVAIAGVATTAMPVLTVSIGVSTAPELASTADELLESAERALAAAQANGRGLIVRAPRPSRRQNMVVAPRLRLAQ